MVGCDIYRYDWVDGDWKKMKSLEGGALFLRDPYFGVHSFGVPAAAADDETKIVANRIYYSSSQISKISSYTGLGRLGPRPNLQHKLYYESWRWPWPMEDDTQYGHGWNLVP